VFAGCGGILALARDHAAQFGLNIDYRNRSDDHAAFITLQIGHDSALDHNEAAAALDAIIGKLVRHDRQFVVVDHQAILTALTGLTFVPMRRQHRYPKTSLT
jgi:hypothetical protein